VTQLRPAAFDALLRRAIRSGRYCPRVARVLSTPAPWDEGEPPPTPSQLQICPKLDTAMTDSQHFNDLTELHHITCAAAYALKSLDGRLECTGESEHFTYEDVAGCIYSIKRSIDMLDQIVKLQGLKGDWIYPDMHPVAEDDVDLFLEQ
jgi:hypothetical protein